MSGNDPRIPYGGALTMEQRLARLEQRLLDKSIGTEAGALIGFDGAGSPVEIPAAAGNGYVATSDNSGTGGVAWVDRGTTDTSQTAVTYATGWSDLGGGYAALRYRRRDGYLYINGVCKKGNTVGSTTTIFTLPVGYRPATNHIVTCIPVVAGALNDAHVYVNSSGTVTLEEAGIVAATVVGYAPINVCIPLA